MANEMSNGLGNQVSNPELSEAAKKLAEAADAAIAAITDPELTPQARATRAIQWAAKYEIRFDQGRTAVARCIADFARSGRRALEHQDFSGFDKALARFIEEVPHVSRAVPPNIDLIPHGSAFGAHGWNQLEHDYLVAMLSPLTPEQRVVSIDALGVTLKSCRRILRAEIRAFGRPKWWTNERAWYDQFPPLPLSPRREARG